jgi:hypothetical protein
LIPDRQRRVARHQSEARPATAAAPGRRRAPSAAPYGGGWHPTRRLCKCLRGSCPSG